MIPVINLQDITEDPVTSKNSTQCFLNYTETTYIKRFLCMTSNLMTQTKFVRNIYFFFIKNHNFIQTAFFILVKKYDLYVLPLCVTDNIIIFVCSVKNSLWFRIVQL